MSEYIGAAQVGQLTPTGAAQFGTASAEWAEPTAPKSLASGPRPVTAPPLPTPPAQAHPVPQPQAIFAGAAQPGPIIDGANPQPGMWPETGGKAEAPPQAKSPQPVPHPPPP